MGIHFWQTLATCRRKSHMLYLGIWGVSFAPDGEASSQHPRMFMVPPASPSQAPCVLSPTAVTRLSGYRAGLLYSLQALSDTGWLHIQRCQSKSPRLGIVRQTVCGIKCAHCQRWGRLGSKISWQREVLELIHKCVGWKLAAEGLQREKKQREKEKGRDRQMERGRRWWKIELRHSFISQPCFTLHWSSLCFCRDPV